MALVRRHNVPLDREQKQAVEELEHGKILCAKPGAGKSRVALAYYMEKELQDLIEAPPILVITTAKKRNSKDWEDEAAKFGIGTVEGATVAGTITVDSWNNITKYTDIEGYFVILDEQRLVGSGAWVKSFYKIAAKNRWIMLSGTPGDTWMDYAPVFIANGFYKNITDFRRNHVVYKSFQNFPVIERYIGIRKLMQCRMDVLVEMEVKTHTERSVEKIHVSHDEDMVSLVMDKRWHVYEDRPLNDAGEMFLVMRKVVNGSDDRIEKLRYLMETHPRIVVFYNFDFELEKLRTLSDEITVAEYNGHKHEDVPTTEKWLYLVQYMAGNEAWNCTETDCMVFYSLTYSYKQYEQAQGRIDRRNTPYFDLYYYVFISNSMIDRAVWRSLELKKDFNEGKYRRKWK